MIRAILVADGVCDRIVEFATEAEFNAYYHGAIDLGAALQTCTYWGVYRADWTRAEEAIWHDPIGDLSGSEYDDADHVAGVKAAIQKHLIEGVPLP